MRGRQVSVHVYPVPGHWLPGVPAIEQDVKDEEEAAALVATGAFTLEPPAEEPDAPAEDEE